MKRWVMVGAFVALVVASVAALAPRGLRWAVLARVPVLPWEWATLEACGAPEDALLRKVLAQRLVPDCPPVWWTARTAPRHAADAVAWWSAAAEDSALPAPLRLGAALLVTRAGGELPAVGSRLAAAHVAGEPLAAALLEEHGARAPGSLDPSALALTAARAWARHGAVPEAPEGVIDLVTAGWLEVDGLEARVADWRRASRDPGGPRVVPRSVGAGAGAGCGPEAEHDCPSAVEGDDGRSATLAPGVRAWVELAALDRAVVAGWLAAWARWAEADGARPAVLGRLTEARGSARPDPLAFDGEPSRGPWTSALGVGWVAEALGEEVTVRVGEGAVIVRWGDAEARAPCAAATGAARQVTPRELLAQAAWERADAADASGRWHGFAARALGAPRGEAGSALAEVLASDLLGADAAPARSPRIDCGARP